MQHTRHNAIENDQIHIYPLVFIYPFSIQYLFLSYCILTNPDSML